MYNRVLIIAEAGVNHNGDIKIAKNLVDAAVRAGADIVKFQTFKAERLVRKTAPKAEYQKNTTGGAETQFEMLKKLEMSEEMHKELLEYCKEKQIGFLSTPFDLESIDLLDKLGMDLFKIPSGEITNYPYLRKIGSLGKKVILSTGMSDLKEIGEAVNVLRENGTDDISVLHCNTQYPTPYEDVNLKAIHTLKKETGLCVGYSDHTRGIEVPIAAVALGAQIIEKHFTLDRNMTGPDHKASLEPNELKEMVKAIRHIEKALGDGQKTVRPSEKMNIEVVRKSIVASRKIQKGEIFSENNLTTKRPGNGISPMRWNEIIGLRAKRQYMEDEPIEI